VIIPGFGTFSFLHKRIDVGNNKFLLIQRPVFALSEKIVQTHGLKSTRYPINGSIPVHPLNYFYIQTQSIYTRDQIEQCVKHVLQIFNRSIATQRNVEFTFSHIGKLQIRGGKVKMRFFKDFVSAVDESGAKLVIENMCNVREKIKTSLLFMTLFFIIQRPQTCDSVMSEREAARPPTSSNVVLPR
jgi:nucleoid DNA-binding protein